LKQIFIFEDPLTKDQQHPRWRRQREASFRTAATQTRKMSQNPALVRRKSNRTRSRISSL